MFGAIKLINTPAIKEMERISDKDIARFNNEKIKSFFLFFKREKAIEIDLIIRNLNIAYVK